MKRLTALGLSVLLLVVATAAFARGGGPMIPNTDIRALEPPIDVTPEQLRAQQYPPELAPPPPRLDGGLYPAPARRRHRRPVAHMGPARRH